MTMSGDKTCPQPPALDLKLDKSVFKRKEVFFAVGLPLGAEFKRVLSRLHDFNTGYVALPRLGKIYTDPKGTKRKLTLVRRIDDPKDWDFLRNLNIDIPCTPDEELSYLESHPNALLVENCPQMDGEGEIILPAKPSALRLPLGYENFPFEQAVRIVLPPSVDAITGFSVVGHVAHFNLKPPALPYRKLIGQIALDKLPRVRTVINKAAKIDTEFRTFAVDLMAGEENYLTEVKENGITFHLDLSKVYWNSRLGTEHCRIVEEIKLAAKASESTTAVVVYDVFAGVGPFSLPVARSGSCQVFANDLNPISFQFLEDNVRRNSSRKHPLSEDRIKCFNLDGRDFIKQIVQPHYEKSLQRGEIEFFMLMNLPGLAIEFLDIFQGFRVHSSTIRPIHTRCYCFIRHALENGNLKSLKRHEADNEARQRVCKALDIELTAITADSSRDSVVPPYGIYLTSWNVRFVRNTAPSRDMYCLEFDLHLPSDNETAKRSRLE